MIATSAVLTVSLFGGTIISTWQAIRANQQSRRAAEAERLAEARLSREQAALTKVSSERDRALEAEEKAEQRFEIAADAVKRYLDEVTRDPQLQNADFRDLRKRLLESAVPFYEELIKQKPADDWQRLKQAQAHCELHRLHYYFFDDFEAALSHAEQSLHICEELCQGPASNGLFQQTLASSCTRLSMAHQRLGNDQKSDEYCRRAVEVSRDLVKSHPEIDAYRSQLATYLGNWTNHIKDPDELSRVHKETLAIREALYQKNPDHPGYRDGLSWWLSGMDDLESRQRSLQIREKLAEDFPDVLKYREFVGRSLTSLGDWYAGIWNKTRTMQQQ
jgi:tetratricopeptide (TPR) repeat protein